MASIERTAYPRFIRLVTAGELTALSPTEEEATWARERTLFDEHMLALSVSLKSFQRLGYFPKDGDDDVPAAVVDHVRRGLGLVEGILPTFGSRTAKSQRQLVRDRLGVVHDRSGRGLSRPTPFVRRLG